MLHTLASGDNAFQLPRFDFGLPLTYVSSTKEAGMKYSICSDTFPGWELAGIFRYAAQLGYQAVELAPYSFCNSVVDVPPPLRGRR